MRYDNLLHRVKYVRAAATIELWETRVFVDSPDAFTVALPDVAEAVGLIYTIRLFDSPDTNTTVSAGAAYILSKTVMATSRVLVAQHDYIVLLSDGTYWHELASGTQVG